MSKNEKETWNWDLQHDKALVDLGILYANLYELQDEIEAQLALIALIASQLDPPE